MTNEEEKKEIVVRAPVKPVTPPEKKEEKITEKALEEERFDVIKISNKVGTYFSISVLVAGVLLLCLFVILMITSQMNWVIISQEMTFLGRLVWIFVSIVNIIGGFLLMGSE